MHKLINSLFNHPIKMLKDTNNNWKNDCAYRITIVMINVIILRQTVTLNVI